ncbi:MAG TPA: hypothetical protein PLU30_05565 [Verrucomicrobiae bacterium]|nr:hypothetical protein [Verrucomicrobiae bacterium]
MRRPLSTFIRVQGIGAAAGNMVCNPLLAWLMNRETQAVTLFGPRGIVLDTAITSVISTMAVTMVVAFGTRREQNAGRLEVPAGGSRIGGWLARLPRPPWALGLVLGAGVALVLVALVLAIFTLLGNPAVPFTAFLVVKAAYTGALGYVVSRWVILRQLLLPAGAEATFRIPS